MVTRLQDGPAMSEARAAVERGLALNLARAASSREAGPLSLLFDRLVNTESGFGRQHGAEQSTHAILQQEPCSQAYRHARAVFEATTIVWRSLQSRTVFSERVRFHRRLACFNPAVTAG